MAYFDKYGVEFSDDRKTLIRCPEDFQGAYAIPDGVKYIGLNNVYLDEYHRKVIPIPHGGTAFMGCTGLTSIIIPNSVLHIYHDAFEGCEGLTSVVIPDSVLTIEEDAFSRCRRLKSISIGNHVIHIGSKAFYGCCLLSSIFIPDSVKEIGYRAFADCLSLTAVTIGTNVFKIDDETFAKCSNLRYLTISEGVNEIGNSAFIHCHNLASVVLPRSVTHIGNDAFCFCYNLSLLLLGCNVEIIGERAFLGCSHIESIKLPKSVLSIGWNAFDVDLGDHYTYLDRIYIPIGDRERFMAKDGLANIQEDIFIEYEEEANATLSPGVSKFCEYLFFDTETTGTPRNYEALVTNLNNWPRLVQLAWITADKEGNVLKKKSVIIKPDGFSIPDDAVAVHGITTEQAQKEGIPLADVLDEFSTDLAFAKQIVGHNINFDQHIVGAELCRMDMDYEGLMNKLSICTMESSVDLCAIPSNNSYYGGYKWPTLQELYQVLFDRSFEDVHDALADITATMECFFELKEIGII